MVTSKSRGTFWFSCDGDANSAFQAGFTIFASTTANCTLAFLVNDNGYYGSGGALTATKTIFVILEKQPAGGGSGSGASAGGAFVGVTTLLSGTVFGIYGALKKKKIIPEEIDPSENDEIFDVTLDNPIYSGNPDALEAVYD